MKVHSARRINANLPVKLTPNSTHHQKRSPTQHPKPTGTCGWNGTDDADDADGANAVGGLQKQYKILQERMGDRSRDRETNIEFV